MQTNINDLLQKRMDRKDFLKHLAVGALMVTGVATILKTVGTMTNLGKPAVQTGYGSSAYGGSVAAGLTSKK
jgi:hypothetical protein